MLAVAAASTSALLKASIEIIGYVQSCCGFAAGCRAAGFNQAPGDLGVRQHRLKRRSLTLMAFKPGSALPGRPTAHAGGTAELHRRQPGRNGTACGHR
jgi:hypothetical protein